MGNLSDFKYFYTYPNLQEDEEIDLFKKYGCGDMSARDKIIRSHLKLVMKVVSPYFFLEQQILEDIVQEGILGLIESIDHFDLDKEIRFNSFAKKYISSYVYDSLKQDTSGPYIPNDKIYKALKLKKYINLTEEQSGEFPTMEEMRLFMGSCGESHIGDLLNVSEIRSYNFCEYSELTPQLNCTSMEDRITISSIIEKIESLPDKDQEIFKLRHFEDNSWREIAKIMNISHESARKRHDRVIDGLRKSFVNA